MIITVKDSNNTYAASCDGEKSSCTAGPRQAAERLAIKMLGVELKRITLVKLPEERQGYYRFKVEQ